MFQNFDAPGFLKGFNFLKAHNKSIKTISIETNFASNLKPIRNEDPLNAFPDGLYRKKKIKRNIVMGKRKLKKTVTSHLINTGNFFIYCILLIF